MSTTSELRSSDADLPVLPVPRAAHCPLAPPPEFVDWREEPGLRRAMFQGNPIWVVSRYQDIRAALVDPRLSAKTIPDAIMPTDADNKVPVMFARTDDPEHHRLRRMMTSNFTFRRCESMRPQIQEMVDHYLGQMIGNGAPADLVREFALPVPSLVIALLLGVPPEDLGLFQQHTTIGLGPEVHRRGEGAGLRGDVRLHRGVGAAQRTRTRRRLDQPPGHRIRRDRPTRPCHHGHEQCDHDAGRPRNHRQHDLVGNGCAAGTSRRVRAARPNRRSRRHREHRRRADALPQHRAQPGRSRGDRRSDDRWSADPRRESSS